MKLIYPFFFALISFILFSCGNGLEYKEEFYESDILKSSYYVDKNGVQQDSFKLYHLNGKIHSVEFKVDGKTNGKKSIYFESGQLEQTISFVNGQHDGPFKEYYDTGTLHIESQYKEDVLTGKYTKYYPDGNIEEEITFEENEENGPFSEYHPNGVIHWKGTYKNGNNEVGLLEEYNTEGELIKKMMCDDQSVCRTTWQKNS